jgi:PAS domain S-box-containing protein
MTAKKKILLAEDTMVQRMAITAWLQRHSFEVEEAGDGAEALHMLQFTDALPDLVIADIGMPHMNGINLCRRIKQDPRTRHVPVIMLTRLGNERNRRVALEAGADDFVTKPVSEQELLYRVNSVLLSSMRGTHPRQDRYREILDALAEGVIVTDQHGACFEANSAARDLLGYPGDAALPENTPLVVEPSDWAVLVQRALEELPAWRGRAELRHQDGHAVAVDAQVTCASVDGRPSYVWHLLAGRGPARAGQPELVDADKLYQMIGLRSADPSRLTADEHDRLVKFTEAVKNAAAAGRIRRYQRKNPETGEVLGRMYIRDELQHIIRNRG